MRQSARTLKVVWMLLWAIGCVGAPVSLWAQTASLFPQVSVTASRGSLFVIQNLEDVPPRQKTGSLFAGQDGSSLFAAYPSPQGKPHMKPGVQKSADRSSVDRLRDLIAMAEAGTKGYDAVQYGAKIRPAKAPTQMTIAEIYHWIDTTPGQPHAIGRYQFIPKTLRALVKRLEVDTRIQFTPAVQDLLADALLADAGLYALKQGEMGRHVFMKNLAKIWAGLPTSTGKSYYHGYAGNKATMTWAFFDAEMRKIFPG